MKIGLNLFPLERDKWTGIELYTYELIKFLNDNSNSIEGYSLSAIDRIREFRAIKYSSFGANNPSLVKKLYYNLFSISNQIGSVDVYHSTNFVLPYFLNVKKSVITIHDFAFLKYPNLFDYKTKSYYKLILEHSIKKADRIICISNSCLQDFEYFFPNPNLISKTRLVYNGFKDFTQVRYNDSLNFGEFILCVGISHERKNLFRILSAFLKLKDEFPNLNLVLTGSDTFNLVRDFISLYGINSGIHHLNFVSENDLSFLYRHAKLLMFPSIYEGFGFPILEAMSVGTPVLTSYSSSCGEISSYPSKFLVNPFSVDDIADKAKLLFDSENRNFLINLGLNRVKEFSWKKMGVSTLSVYED